MRHYLFLVWDGSGLVEMDENKNGQEIHHVCELKVAAIRHMTEHLEIELAANNLHHVMRVVDNTKHLFTILDDIETAQRRLDGYVIEHDVDQNHGHYFYN
ncbi:13274_t:CDS:2, partial [Ambispora leptoticha]